MRHENVSIVAAKRKRETYDEEALYVIKKMVKNNKETIAMTSKEKAASYLTENNYLEQFMPIMVSTEHLKKAVDDIVSRIDNPNSKSMGIIMKELKVKFKGNYDGKLASIIVKEILASV